MKHNRPIYHCQCCGAVVRQEAFRLPPFCCGCEMIKAAEETLQDDFAHELDIEPALVEPRLAPRWTAQEPEHVSV
jgi:hypothetical protein